MIKPEAAGGAMEKAALRAQALARRNELGEADRREASQAIAACAGDILAPLLPGTIAFYRPIGSECDTAALIDMARSHGAALGLPAIVDETTIVFRRYRFGDRLVAGGFGTSAPAPDEPLVEPDVIVLPVVAFDRRGARLGYGRGHYDRAITALREAGRKPKLLGIAFSVQEIARIPAEPHDVHLDWIVTEKETLDFRVNKD